MEYDLEIIFQNDYEDETFTYRLSEEQCKEFARDIIKQEAGLYGIKNKDVDKAIDYIVTSFDLIDVIFRDYDKEAQEFFYDEAREQFEQMGSREDDDEEYRRIVYAGLK